MIDPIDFHMDYAEGLLTCRYQDRYLTIPMDEVEDMKHSVRSEKEFHELVSLVAWNRMGFTGKPPTTRMPSMGVKTQSKPSKYEAYADNRKFSDDYVSMLRQIETLKAEQNRAQAEGYGRSPTDFGTDTASAQRIRMQQMEYKVQMMQKQMDEQMERNHRHFIEEQLKNQYNGKFEAEPDPRGIPPGYRGSAKTPSDDWAGSSSYSYEQFKKEYENHGFDSADIPKPEKPKPEDKIMANKFLPFIVEKSTPQHVYHTLLSRSKGMNINLVTSIFYMVMDKGVAELREFVKTLPDGISVGQMYEEMVGKYSHYQIMDEEFTLFLNVAPLLSSHDWAAMDKELTKELNSKDIMAFLYVMYKLEKVNEFTNLDFVSFMDTNRQNAVLSDIPTFTNFADDGLVTEFEDSRELKTFILYNALLRDKDTPLPGPLKIVFNANKGEQDSASR